MTARATNLRLCILAAALSLLACGARASGDPLQGVLPPGDAGIGFSLGLVPAPYLGAQKNSDFLPLLVYDSENFYLESYRFCEFVQDEIGRGRAFGANVVAALEREMTILAQRLEVSHTEIYSPLRNSKDSRDSPSPE